MTDIPEDNWSERDDRNAEVAPFGWPPGVPAQIELIGRMMMGAIKRSWNRSNPVYQTSGTGDDFVVVTESQPDFIHLYEIIRIRLDRSNTTTTPTFKFAKTNARTIVKVSNTGVVALVAGDLVAGRDHQLWYNGSNWVLSDPSTIDAPFLIGVLKTANNLSELTATAATARTNIGLGNVDNTADANKPVSTAQSNAISSAFSAAISYTDAGLATKLSLAGGTMQGPINFNYQTISNPGGLFLQGHLYGLTLSNSTTNAANAIDIAIGSAATDSSVPTLMTLAAALGKRVDTAWAVGGTPASPNGGLDTGTVGNNTYHVWLIQRSDTGVVDALFSLSATAPTMPANYDRKRRIGSIVRTSSVNRPFKQRGDTFIWSAAKILDVSSVNPGTAAVTRTLSVPVGIEVDALTNTLVGSGTSSSLYALITSLDEVDRAPTNADYTHASASLNMWTGVPTTIKTNTSAQIRTRLSASGASDQLLISTLGYIDTRGRL